MILKLELTDDAGVTFANQVDITSLELFPQQVGLVCLQIQQMIRSGQMTFRPPRPEIVLAQSVPTSTGKSGK